MRLDSLQMFVRVAELASFSRAAENLGQPKATVSMAVREIEAELGVQLLHRTTRRVQLTHDGQAFLDRARDLLSDADDLSAMFQADPAVLTGRVRVDMPVNMSETLVTPALPAFIAAHPKLDIELSSTDRMVDIVREGFDCVVRVGASPDSGLMARQLGRAPLANVASPAYLARYGVPKTLADLDRHHLVHYAPQLGAKPYGFEYRDGAAYKTRAMQGAVTVNNSSAYRCAALAGLGIIQAPRMGLLDVIASGALVEILPDLPCEPMPVAIIYPQRRNLARRVRVFIDWLDALIRPHMAA